MSRRLDPLVIDMPVPAGSFGSRAASLPEWPDKVLLFGIIAISIWAPLAFGTTEVWSQFIQRSVAFRSSPCGWQNNFCMAHRGAKIPHIPPLTGYAALVILQIALNLTAYRYATISELLNLAVYGSLVLISADLFVFVTSPPLLRRRHGLVRWPACGFLDPAGFFRLGSNLWTSCGDSYFRRDFLALTLITITTPV